MAATNKKIRVRKGTDNAIRDFSDRLNDNTALFTLVPELYGTGTSNTYRKCVAKGLYDFSVLTGAIGSYNLLSTDEVIPDNAIVTNVYIDVITAFTSTGGTGTIALTLNTAGDLLAAVDADTLSTGPNAGIPDGAVANMVKATAARNLVLSIATAAITAGKAVVFVEYVISE